MDIPKTIRFLAGTTEDGTQIFGDFQKTGNFISSGHTGSGHASFDEGSFVTDLLQFYTPEELQFVMIDPKQVQLVPYDEVPHLWRPLVLTPDAARSAVSDLLDELKRRTSLFEKLHSRSLAEYNEDSKEKLPFIILLGTEIADLMMIDGKFYLDAFEYLALKGPSVGIHLYLATQRPSADVLPDRLLKAISGRLVFAVASDSDSERLLGGNEAAQIKEAGMLYFADYSSDERYLLKAPYVSDAEVEHIVNKITARS